MLAVGLSEAVFIRLGKFSSITTLMRIYQKQMLILSSAFCISIDIILQFFLVIMENYIHFHYIHFQTQHSEVNPLCCDVLSFSYIVELNLLTCCLQFCIYICFYSGFFLLIMSFLCVAIRIMLTSVNELGSISSYSVFLKSFIALGLFLL